MTGRPDAPPLDAAEPALEPDPPAPHAEGPASRVPLVAPRFARAVLIGVFTGFYLVSWTRILYSTSDLAAIVLSGAYMTAIAALQLLYFTRPRLESPGRYIALGLQAALVYIPMAQFHQQWVALPGFLAGSVLLALPWPGAWAAFAAVVASMALAQLGYSGAPLDVVYTGVSTAITGLVVYGLTRLANVVNELHQARAELAEMAVTSERLRIARDLHDLLGYNLSAVTLKAELARRVMPTDPGRADEELVELLTISRRALADVRAVSRGYRELSLDDEARAARSVLVAADVDVNMELDYGDLPKPTRTVLATVLREGVTNVLRHSRATHCEIRVAEIGDRVVVELVNDGVAEAGGDATRGSGIANLTERIRSIGGEIMAGLEPDRRFRLRAAVPVEPGARADGTAVRAG